MFSFENVWQLIFVTKIQREFQFFSYFGRDKRENRFACMVHIFCSIYMYAYTSKDLRICSNSCLCVIHIYFDSNTQLRIHQYVHTSVRAHQCDIHTYNSFQTHNYAIASTFKLVHVYTCTFGEVLAIAPEIKQRHVHCLSCLFTKIKLAGASHISVSIALESYRSLRSALQNR